MLKGKENSWFNSCIVISICPLNMPSIRNATKYRNNDKLTS